MARKWSARSLRNLKGIHPDLRRVFERALRETPNDFAVTCGLRSIEEQRRMVAEGASQTMNSAHLTGYAVDVAYYDARGQIVWDWPVYDRNAEVIKRIADEEGVPIQWGGDWASLRDGPHFELHRDHYDWQAPFTARPVARTEAVTRAASEHKGDIAATVSTVGGAVGSAVAAAQDAPAPLQYAIAAVIVLGAAAFIWTRVRA